MNEIKQSEATVIENTTETKEDAMQVIFDATKVLLDELKEGEKISLRDLTDKVVYATKKPISIVNGLVSYYTHNGYVGVRVERGRTGGVIKGAKVQHIDRRARCTECTQVIPQQLLEKLNAAKDQPIKDQYSPILLRTTMGLIKLFSDLLDITHQEIPPDYDPPKNKLQ